MRKKFTIGVILMALGFSAAHAVLPKTLSFASDAAYPPFESVNASGELQGFDIDLARAICQQINIQCIFSNHSWESLIPGLKLGEFDAVISAMAITEARKREVSFSNPYFVPTGIFIANTKSTLSPTPEGLKGKIIGVQKGTTYEQYLNQEYGKFSTVKTYANFQDIMLDLQAGKIDVALGDSPTVENWLGKENRNIRFMLLGEPIYDPWHNGEGYGIAVKKDNTELLQAINEGLKEIKKNGTYQKIFFKYFFNIKPE